jgi:hypothetical protein
MFSLLRKSPPSPSDSGTFFPETLDVDAATLAARILVVSVELRYNRKLIYGVLLALAFDVSIDTTDLLSAPSSSPQPLMPGLALVAPSGLETSWSGEDTPLGAAMQHIEPSFFHNP